MKKIILSISILLCVCLISYLAIYIIDNNTTTSYCSSSSSINISDFENLKFINSFDVNDFATGNINTIDIPSLKYTNNEISINNSKFTISKELQNKIKNQINNYGAASSFYIISLNDGMSIGYNVDRSYETASSIKAPYALYVYHEIANGKINPNDKVTYQAKYYNKGTGIIKNSSFGTEYKVSDLLYYSLNDSDNIAHIMLHKTFGVTGYNNMLKKLGTQKLYLTANNPWGFTSPRSAAIIWQDIYNFALTNETGIELLNILSNGKYNYYKEILPNTASASKTGFASKDVLETGIIFDDNPYIAIAMANKGGNYGAYTQVLKLLSSMNDIMNEYKNYQNK